MKNAKNNTLTSTKGYSLFEMLSFVCILSIMITLALPLFATSEGAQQATDQRNAQHFCSLASAANAAGIKVVDSKAKNTQEEIVEVLKQIRKGIEVKRGPLKGRTFKLPNVTDEEIKGASRYIAIEEGEMIYSPVISGSSRPMR